jgi:signal recognition particle receptor subunit beta
MVFFNYATMQMAAKIVYYGPGLCGKTTNLHHIYTKTAPQSRGEMVSLETETDRTLFFDLLPIDVGVIGGFKTRLQLYTVPGQVFYNTTRKLVLKGVDGIVFVADSQKAMLDANVESLKNLRENLAEIGLNMDEIPLVIQLNKRDLPNISDADVMVQAMDPERKFEHVEAVAAQGSGVFETLKTISKLTLRTLRRRMTGEEPAKPAAPRPSGIQFKVQETTSTPPPSQTRTAPIPALKQPLPPAAAVGTAAPAASPSFTNAAAATTVAEPVIQQVAPPPVAEPVAPPPPPHEETLKADELTASAANLDSRILSDVPVADVPALDELMDDDAPSTQYIPPPSLARGAAPPEPAPAPAPVPEPEIDFGQSEKPQKAAPEVKTVKVRSSIDVMAELEALRKRATNTGSVPKAKKEPAAPAPEIVIPKPKRDVTRNVALQVPAAAVARARSVRVTVSFSDGDQEVVGQQDHTVELGDASDVQSLLLNLKVDLV